MPTSLSPKAFAQSEIGWYITDLVESSILACRVLRLPAPYRLARGKRNPIAAWLDVLGLFGLRSYEKFVPAEVFALPKDEVALVSRAPVGTDGCIAWDHKRRMGRIYYGSSMSFTTGK